MSGSDFAAARFSSAGVLDTASFHSPDGYVKTGVQGDSTDDGAAVAVDSSGRTVVAGTTDAGGTDQEVFVLRYMPNGTLDNTFGTNGVVITDVSNGGDDAANDVAIDGNGRIIVVGESGNGGFAVLRYTPAGVLDTTFDGDGKAFAQFSFNSGAAEGVAIDGSNRIVVGGTATVGGPPDFAVARFLPGGALDTSFDTDGKATVDIGANSTDEAADLAIDGMGRIVIAGTQTSSGAPVFAVARLTSTGGLDGTFDGDGKRTKSVGGDDSGATSVAIDSSNGIVIAGEFFAFSGGCSGDFALVRLTEAGADGPGFGTNGVVTTDIDGATMCDRAEGVAFDQNGKIVAGGGHVRERQRPGLRAGPLQRDHGRARHRLRRRQRHGDDQFHQQQRRQRTRTRRCAERQARAGRFHRPLWPDIPGGRCGRPL